MKKQPQLKNKNIKKKNFIYNCIKKKKKYKVPSDKSNKRFTNPLWEKKS